MAKKTRKRVRNKTPKSRNKSQKISLISSQKESLDRNQGARGKESMAISEWLDEKEAKNLDVSQIALPDDLSYDDIPDETIFFGSSPK